MLSRASFVLHFLIILDYICTLKIKFMDIILIGIGAVFMLVGLTGCILPIIPGPPLGYIGLLFLHFTERFQFDSNDLFLWAFIAVIVTVADNVLPIWTTKKFGGSKAGVWGSTLGLILGLFFAPVGIIVGPFIGAVLGEMLNNNNDKALKAGFGAFMGFVFGVGLKLASTGYFAWLFAKTVF